jgi:uncharacterized membrane protein
MTAEGTTIDTLRRPGGRVRAVNVGDGERVASALAGGALVLYGLVRRSPGGIALALAGGLLAWRGITGRCPLYRALDLSSAEKVHGTGEHFIGGPGVDIRRSITINRPAGELYRFWRDFSNLPLFMKGVESVQPLSDTLTHWMVRAPFGTTVEWDAEIINDHENELIAWHSREPSDVTHAGLVRFRETERGTVVETRISYRAPLRGLGVALAKLFGEDPAGEVEADLRRLKMIMETGEVPTTEGQPSGARR